MVNYHTVFSKLKAETHIVLKPYFLACFIMARYRSLPSVRSFVRPSVRMFFPSSTLTSTHHASQSITHKVTVSYFKYRIIRSCSLICLLKGLLIFTLTYLPYLASHRPLRSCFLFFSCIFFFFFFFFYKRLKIIPTRVCYNARADCFASVRTNCKLLAIG